jgi:hypothetical protein
MGPARSPAQARMRCRPSQHQLPPARRRGLCVPGPRARLRPRPRQGRGRAPGARQGRVRRDRAGGGGGRQAVPGAAARRPSRPARALTPGVWLDGVGRGLAQRCAPLESGWQPARRTDVRHAETRRRGAGSPPARPAAAGAPPPTLTLCACGGRLLTLTLCAGGGGQRGDGKGAAGARAAAQPRHHCAAQQGARGGAGLRAACMPPALRTPDPRRRPVH